ncbi:MULTISPECIES: response regulator transcription factor [unclassified Sphingobacterium]|uniref:response regulator transcription factor n=1 Tax=unclassified Sphingobacterium TaxID=2609468 RepID=UPI0020C410A8|nr:MULTISPECIES: helix-turn-helix transcriptional regulator [unclassified Sphingobacterium]
MITLDAQLFEISHGLNMGNFSIPDLGDILPASLMIHDLNGNSPNGCSYMNHWGTSYLGVYPEEIPAMGMDYYDHFFVKEEIFSFFVGLQQYIINGEADKTYNFFQRVKRYADQQYQWCFTSCKLAKIQTETKLILISAPIDGLDHIIQRVNKTLDQNEYVHAHYKKYAQLTKREKEIIRMLANGFSTSEISDQLFLSSHTVSTHRKNICKKLENKSFAELLKFAVNFDLT